MRCGVIRQLVFEFQRSLRFYVYLLQFGVAINYCLIKLFCVILVDVGVGVASVFSEVHDIL